MNILAQITILCLLLQLSLAGQSNRIAYSYLSANFEKAIPEYLDKDELTTKEKKLYDKFMKSLNRSLLVNFEKKLSMHLEKNGNEIMPLNAVGVMGNSALNMDGYPFIFFPKKTLKKNVDKNVADEFVSATITISKPIAAVIGLKPTINVSLKKFNKTGELLDKATVVLKTENKISSIGFAVNQNENFSKIDLSHAQILYDKIEETMLVALEDAVNQLESE